MFGMFKYEYKFIGNVENKEGPETQFQKVIKAKDYCEALHLFWSSISDKSVISNGRVQCGLVTGYF